ncbi:hypothetical protein FQR65_LT17658 [Abscondita terminalis]|nr:hypothetical protein FQR65_LT17658 [Abscondita terminalis]
MDIPDKDIGLRSVKGELSKNVITNMDCFNKVGEIFAAFDPEVWILFTVISVHRSRKNYAIGKAYGMSEDKLQEAKALNNRVYKVLKSNLSDEEVKKQLADVAANDKALSKLTSKWFRYFIRFDPVPVLKAGQMSLYSQYMAERISGFRLNKNLQIRCIKISEANRHKMDFIKMYPDLNHLFQHAHTGLINEYGELEETFSYEVGFRIIDDCIIDVTHSGITSFYYNVVYVSLDRVSGYNVIDHPVNNNADIQGINHYFGWYNGKIQDVEQWADKITKDFAGYKIIFSEYGAEANPKHQQEAVGLLNQGQLEEDPFYWVISNWSKEPVLYLTQRRVVERGNQITPVTVYSNIGTPQLFVNGEEIKTFRKGYTDVHYIFEQVKLKEGENIVEVKGLKSGKRFLEDKITWHYAKDNAKSSEQDGPKSK